VDTPIPTATVSKAEFRFARILLTIGLTSAEFILWLIADLKFNWSSSNLGAFVYPLFMANWFFSWYAVDRYYKAAGSSLSRKTTETWERTPFELDFTPKDGESVELVMARADVYTTFVFGLVFAVLCLLGPFYFSLGWIITILALLVSIAMGMLVIQQWFAWDGCILRADSKGILAYPRRLAPRRVWLSWSEIAFCEITTHYDTFGAPYLIVPVFKDEFGRTLMRTTLVGGLMSMTFAQQQRLASFIKARFTSKPTVALAEV
jgi:hypothetical protein